MEEKNRRRHQRVKCPCFIKFCIEGEGHDWDIAPIRNISEGGILFNSSKHYEPGSQLNMAVYHSQADSNKICKGKVMRCDKIDKIRELYEVVIDIAQVDENMKASIYKIMEAFSKNKDV